MGAGSVRSWDPTAGQKEGWQRLLARTPTIAAQRLGSPKGVWTTGRQGGGSARGAGLRWTGRPHPGAASSDPPQDPPLGQRREPEAPARAPATGS